MWSLAVALSACDAQCQLHQPSVGSWHLPAVPVPNRPPVDAPKRLGGLWPPNRLGEADGGPNVGVLLAPAGVPNADALLAAPNMEGVLAAPKPKPALLGAPNAGVLAAPKAGALLAPNSDGVLLAPKPNAGADEAPNTEALEAPPKGVPPNAMVPKR
jgi:hypothetical protein